MLVTVSWVFIVLGIITALTITASVTRNPQPMKVMNVTWPVSGLYLPVVGWWIYKRLGQHGHHHHEHSHQNSHSHHHDHGNKPFWQSVFVSTSHCGGGCVLGDSVAAPLMSLLGATLFGSALVGHFAGEFFAAYAFGILFQLLPILSMGNDSWLTALKNAVKADTLSLVAFEIGMFGWMTIAAFLWLGMEPRVDTPQFWFMMQIAMVLGFATAYPANWWLVRRGIKHAM